LLYSNISRMKSFDVVEHKKPLVLTEKPIPSLKPPEVLVRILVSGICHSDIHIHDGAIPVPIPTTMGHEATGEVVDVGSEVKNIKVGDKVIVYSWLTLDPERNYPYCIGVGMNGTHATHVVVPEERYCVKIENNISLEEAALLACSGVTAYTALKKVKELLDKRWKSRVLVIIGVGGVGLQAVRFSKIVTGVAPIVCDVSDKRLYLAKQIGPEGTITVNSSNPADALKTIQSLTDRRGADAVIDFVGLTETFNFGVSLLSLKQHVERPGKYIIVGLYGAEAKLPLKRLIFNIFSVEGSFTGSLEDMKELLNIFSDHKVKSFPISKKSLSLESLTEGLEALKKGLVDGRIVMCAKL